MSCKYQPQCECTQGLPAPVDLLDNKKFSERMRAVTKSFDERVLNVCTEIKAVNRTVSNGAMNSMQSIV